MAFSASTPAPADVQTSQGSGHLDHHQKLRAALLELRGAGLAIEADVPELARDAVGAALVAGANITITVNDAGDTITIAATGGSSADVSKLEALVAHDGTAGGGTRPSGYFRVRWVGGTARPTNMVSGDVWERDA